MPLNRLFDSGQLIAPPPDVQWTSLESKVSCAPVNTRMKPQARRRRLRKFAYSASPKLDRAANLREGAAAGRHLSCSGTVLNKVANGPAENVGEGEDHRRSCEARRLVHIFICSLEKIVLPVLLSLSCRFGCFYPIAAAEREMRARAERDWDGEAVKRRVLAGQDNRDYLRRTPDI
jgi:hypothetical protein